MSKCEDLKEYTDFETAMSRQLLIGEVVARNARKFPDREILIFGNRRVTCQELDKRVNRLANAMLSLGIKKGEKIGVLMQNCLEELEIFYAACKIGAVSVPLNFRLSPREVSYILNNSDTKILFAGSNFLDMVEKIKNENPLLTEIVAVHPQAEKKYRDFDELLSSGSPIRPEVWLSDEDDAFIIYTSGTTGKAKGAVLTHKNITVQAMTLKAEAAGAVPRRPELQPIKNRRSLTFAPLFHIAGITNTIKTMLSMTPIVIKDFDPVDLLKTVEKERITEMFLAPAMWQMVMSHPDFKKYDVSSLAVAFYGASPMSNSLKEQVLEAFPNAELSECFGQTEMAPSTTKMNHQDALRKEGSVGCVLFNTEMRVVDDDMNDVPVGEVGEAVYRGPSMFKGYYKNLEANREAFKGGWFHSGDLVRRDEEGFIYVADRKKDMIISGGENIYSAEVEGVLQAHPCIQESAVIGIPDPKWGEAVKAFVILKPGKETTSQEIIRFCEDHLARFKRPKVIQFLKALPRNAAGKVLKKDLRDL